MRSLQSAPLDRLASEKEVGESGLIALDWWNGNRSVLADGELSGLHHIFESRMHRFKILLRRKSLLFMPEAFCSRRAAVAYQFTR